MWVYLPLVMLRSKVIKKLARQCALGGLAFGAGLELVGTPMYDILHQSGVDEYKILEADPKGNNKILVPLMGKYSNGSYYHQNSSPHERRPDLVLAGSGEKERIWVEFKSYANFKDLRVRSGKLAESKWSGIIKSSWTSSKSKERISLTKFANAHRQASLDYLATTTGLLSEYWEKDGVEKGFATNKPAESVTWVQVWREETSDKEWRQLFKDIKGKYRFREVTASARKKPDPAFIGYQNLDGDIIGLNDVGLVTEITPEFRALQRFLGSIPTKFDVENPQSKVEDPDGREISTGLTPKQYYNTVKIESQSTENASDVKVRPFTVANFFSIASGKIGKDKIFDELEKKFGNSDVFKLFEDIQKENLSPAEILEMRERIQDEMLKVLGPLGIIVDINDYIPTIPTKWVEDKIGDYLLGDNIEELRQYAAEYELPDLPGFSFAEFCADLN